MDFRSSYVVVVVIRISVDVSSNVQRATTNVSLEVAHHPFTDIRVMIWPASFVLSYKAVSATKDCEDKTKTIERRCPR